jgi:hypothetical protein
LGGPEGPRGGEEGGVAGLAPRIAKPGNHQSMEAASASTSCAFDDGVGPSGLDALPRDLLLQILSLLDPSDVVVGGACCKALQHLSACDDLWRMLLWRHYAPVLRLAFGGRLASPLPPLSWRQHFFSFRNLWMVQAARPPHCRAIFSIRGHVYDATDFVDDHPGLPAFLLSAAGTDASAAFALAGHSENARKILQRFAVPSLDPFQPQPSWPCGGGSAASGESLGVGGGRESGSGPSGSGPSGSGPSGSGPSGGSQSRPSPPVDGGGGGGGARGEGGSSSDGVSGEGGGARAVFELVRGLMRTAEGRRQLVDALCGLVYAAVVDLERSGREPVGIQQRVKPGTAAAGIQRFLPVMWETTRRKTMVVSRLLG